MKVRCAIIGTGMIGQAWAILFARAGYAVSMWDPDAGALSRAAGQIDAQLAMLFDSGSMTATPASVAARIRPAPSLQECVADADYVQENGPERLESRRALFVELDRLTPPTAIIASSTSGMRPSLFTATLMHRHRCLVAHPANPPHLLPLVEVCPAPWTAPEVIETAVALLRGAEREVALLHAECDGFVLNRLQGALLGEAFRLVAQGIVDVMDVDKVVKHALGPRWALMGPFETIDLNAPGGIGDFYDRYAALYATLPQSLPPFAWDEHGGAQVTDARRAALPLSQLTARQAWRDTELMALAAHLARHRTPPV